MTNLNIPDEGLRIPGPSSPALSEKPNARAAYPTAFAVKINITERFLEELSSGKQNALTLNTGKGRMSLQVGSNQFEFMHTQELFHNELYRQTDENDVVSLGMLKDKLELLEVVEKRNADADLLALKKEMELLQQKKKDKSVQLVSNPSKLGPELSGRRGLIAAKKAGIQTAVMKTKVNKRTKFSNSMPSSPALNATASRSGKGVTSAPKPKSVRKDPLFLPLIHLLALGPEKEQALAMKTHTDLDKCSGIVIQIANRGISGRWELHDEMFKDLDVWKFKYPKQEMREQAIENAEDAFDRMKLPEDAPEWELLRKPEDRGKPRPPRQPRKKQPEPEAPKKKAVVAAASPALPPTIKISKEESISSSPALGAEPMARSVSQPMATTTNGPKRPGNAENNALKKIIGNKKGPKPKTTTTPKVAAPKEKKSSTPSTNSPATLPSKPSPAISSHSSAVASSAPAVVRKPPARYRTEYKSAEFISDSDSDDNMDIDTPQKPVPSSSSSSSSSSGQPLYAKSARANMAKTDARPAKIPSKRPAAISISGKQDASSPATNGHKRNASMSASPAKPSPLGSSPPMTASDLVRQSSTASSSPLSSVATPDDLSTPMIHPSYTSAPISTPKSSAEKVSSKPRYIPEGRDSASPQHKRKAEEPPAIAERPRKRVLSSGSEDSDESKKRRPAVEERPTIARKGLPKSSQVTEPVRSKKEPIKTVANGVSKKDFEEVRQQRKDLPRGTYASSTASTTSNVSMSSSDLSSRGGKSRFRAAEENITLLAKYKRLHDEYRTRYEKVLHDPDPSTERVNQVMDLHDRLAEMKIMIRRTVLAS